MRRVAQRARLVAWLLPSLSACALSEPAPARQTALETLRPDSDATAGAQVPGAWRFDLRAPPTRAQHALVDSDAELASRAGLDVLASGGNAVDAAISVAFVLAAVYPEAGNLGGGGFALVRSPDGARAALDFRETAPAAAARDMYSNAQDARVGPRAAGVPGSVAGLWAPHQRFGTKPWADLLAPAIHFAEQGFPVDAEFVGSSTEALPRLARFAASRSLFLRDGAPLAAGDSFRNPDLARVLDSK